MIARMEPMPERLLRAMTDPAATPWLHALIVFLGSSFAGLASHLREGGVLTYRMVASAMLNSGMLGMIVFLIGFSRLADDLPLLVGISLLAGVGSASLMTFALQLLRRRLAQLMGVDACPLPPEETSK